MDIAQRFLRIFSRDTVCISSNWSNVKWVLRPLIGLDPHKCTRCPLKKLDVASAYRLPLCTCSLRYHIICICHRPLSHVSPVYTSFLSFLLYLCVYFRNHGNWVPPSFLNYRFCLNFGYTAWILKDKSRKVFLNLYSDILILTLMCI